MKKTIVWMFLIIILYALSSCTALRRSFKPSGFTYKYDGKYTGLDTLIDIDGYYKSIERQSEPNPNPDSRITRYHSALMFYRDGLVCYIISDNPWKTFRDRLYPVRSWGTYKVYGDTIKCQFISDLGAMGGVPVRFITYHIVSKAKIEEIDREGGKIMHSFYPLENRIDSTEWNWALKKKWFWEKEAWKNRKDK
jgi:hypothetical protein